MRFGTVTKPCAIRPVLLNHRRIVKVMTSLSQGNSVDESESCTLQNHFPRARQVDCPGLSRYRGPQEEPTGLARPYASGAMKHVRKVAYTAARTSCNLAAQPVVSRPHFGYYSPLPAGAY